MNPQEPQEEPGRQAPRGQGLASAAVLMVAATFAARVAGMVRMMVIGHVFGTRGGINSFFVAFTIPDLLYFLMAGGAARTAFVPVFTELLTKNRLQQAYRTFSSVFWLLAIVGGLLVAGGVLLADHLAKVSAVGWLGTAPERVDLTARIMRIVFPAQLFLVLGGLLMGALNAYKHFLWPAMGPLVYDVLFIGGALVAATLPEGRGLDALALSAVIGATCGNLLLQAPALARRGVRLLPVLDVTDEAVRRVIRLALPVMLGLAVAEINWVIVRVLATMCEPDAPAILEYANRLWKLPSGVFAAGIAIAVFPSLSEHYTRGDVERYRRDFSFALRNALFLVLPVAVAFGVLATPIVRMLFQRGSFDPITSPIVGHVLVWLTPGMVALGINYICARAFYARQNTVTPTAAGLVSIAACLGLGYWAAHTIGVVGLAMATSAGTVLNAALLVVLLKREVGLLDGARIVRSVARMLPGCVALGIVCRVGSEALAQALGTTAETAKVLTVMAPLAAGGLCFLGISAAMRAEELWSAGRLLAARIRRANAGRKPPPDGTPGCRAQG